MTEDQEKSYDAITAAFITVVHTLAKHCEFGALREELIRDRFVIGIRKAELSEILQLDPDLTLEKAITRVRQSAVVKTQQPILRGAEQIMRLIEAGHKKNSHSAKGK